MSFTVVIDTNLQLALVEFASIVDLELKSDEYKQKFQKLADSENYDEITKELLNCQQFFLRNFKKRVFEATVNLYIHITSLLREEDKSLLLKNFISNVDLTDSSIEKSDVTAELSIIALTNIFNVLPATSKDRYTIISAIVRNIKAGKLCGVISNISKNIETYLSEIENVSSDEASEIVLSIYEVCREENESDSISFIKLLIQNNKIELNSKVLSAFFINTLTADSLYDISSLIPIFTKIDNASLVKLLNLYVQGDYKSFVESKNEFTPLCDSDKFEILNLNFKSLSILSYFATSKNSSNIFDYNTISNDLNIPVSDIELSLFTLITQNLVVGKLSQSTNSFILNQINYTAPSLNNIPTDWNEVSSLLSAWNNNINNLQSIVQELISKRGKRVNAPQVIMSFHQQKVEAKKAQQLEAEATQANTPVEVEEA